ncbi:MAG: hypothetical protein HY924_08690 [Elusimicrobia bacterium]|nr:hypothetical protein [Elusimicrobiota bacterium]
MIRRGIFTRSAACIQVLVLAFPGAASFAQPAAVPGPPPFRFDRPGPIEAPKPEAPVSLTSSDGTGLKLSRMTARAVVEGPLAFTELQLAFENPEDRVIEGRFRVVMPQGASVSRFAMKNDSGWQEGEVVERAKARAAYEDFLHRRQDPALLEMAAGNEFSARVFPIPARGVKELIISYSQELGRAEAPYALPLKGLPEVGSLDAAVSAGGEVLAELKKTSYVPARDFEAPLPAAGPSLGLRHGELAVVRVRPVLKSQPEPVGSLLVLFDTSASRALGFESQRRLLAALIEGLAKGSGPGTPVTVAAFDQTVRLVYEGTAGGFGDEAMASIRKDRALGASDLMRAVEWAAGALKARPAKRVLLITDGVATQGETGPEELAAAVKKLKAAGAERMDAVAVGGIRDEDLLKRLVTAGLPKDGAVADGKLPIEEIGAKLTEATSSGLEVAVEGASWVWPKTLQGLQAKDDVFVFARLPGSKAFKLSIGRRVVHTPPESIAKSQKPLVERAWAKAMIASLLRKHESADGSQAKAKVQDEIVDLSVKHRVVAPFTSLLVLETAEDYVRYGIDRKALADILTVADHGIRIVQRPPESIRVPEPQRPSELSLFDRIAGNILPAKSMPMAGAMASLDGSAGMQGSAEPPAESEAFQPGAAGADYDTSMAAPDVSYGGGAMAGVSPMLMPRPSAAPEPSPVPSVAAMRGAEEARAREEMGSRQGAMARRMPSRLPPDSPHPVPPGVSAEQPQKGTPPYTGKFKDVMELIRSGQAQKALTTARSWLEETPGDVMALVAMGEACEALSDWTCASRAYGSIIDLYASRADLRRYAGARLERVRGGLDLAVDSYAKAVDNRPDHPSSHRLYAFGLLKQGRHRQAFEAMAKGVAQRYPAGRFRGVERILAEDLGLIAAAWIKAEPGRKTEILQQLTAAGGVQEKEPSLRFVLNWETDANDVDFHIYDGKGGHAYYSQPLLSSGGELYADVTTGYGPECFTIRKPRSGRAFPYTLQAHYYSRGPMGYGMGKLSVIEHDGNGTLGFEERPFVVMVDSAFVDLGGVKR